MSAPKSGAAAAAGAKDDRDLRETRARSLMTTAIGLTAVGIGLAGTVSREGGGVVVVAGWVTLVYALHAFGRAGSRR